MQKLLCVQHKNIKGDYMRARSSPGDGLLKNVCEARWSNIRRGDKGHSGPERTLAVVFFGEEIIMKYYGTPGRNY
jgi:hypothetical protein